MLKRLHQCFLLRTLNPIYGNVNFHWQNKYVAEIERTLTLVTLTSFTGCDQT